MSTVPEPDPSVHDLPGSAVPPIEDASEPDAIEASAVSDDAPEEVLLDTTARTLDEAESAPPAAAQAAGLVRRVSESDGDITGGDLMDLPEEVPSPGQPRPRRKGDWECELSGHNVAIELKRIESEVRSILEDRDPRRKRKLSGTSRWHELEDDLFALRYTGRIDEGSLRRLRDLINRRHYLFRHLRFLASTRPTWNT